ncbi:MAG: DUF4105 domain-containing protein [Cypionkella sp.]|uniref:lipoprotein N-acyltransferase Lnb domain-containing protein n=1 Tax=Cypionkella sp. TaxID=2811411 RepID=UPI002ABA7E75|nr:DUF4105 domain-containing protein [Cypionkella sp.]MDZ4313062.1 DUF4105 domain-containing protein [Cypionkella sp.]MDZ4395601.1 DUF4105 domain-containing protein [Cypionkella sp.]
MRDTSPTRRIWRGLGHAGFVILLALATAWAATALYIQLTGPVRIAALVALGLAFLAILILRFQKRRHAWAGFAVAVLAVGGWYQTIQPRQDRDWAADVAHGVSGVVAGDQVRLSNVRNFDWTSDSAATPRWESRSYDLSKLESVDMLTSTWGDPNIAHLIVSFGFAGGEHVAFSVEIRRESDEVFSSIGGFFRQFELVLIAADEADIVKLRTNYRGEDVHRFPVKLDAAQRRALLLRYIAFGNELAEAPVFYNTVTANCASTVYGLVQVIKPDMPLDSRLLFSGQLPEYIDELGGLPGDMPMDQRRKLAAISAVAKTVQPGQDFSGLIRGQ